jgi:hypothetical protein
MLKERKMNRLLVFRIVLLLALVGAVIGVGVLAYNAGMTQGYAIATVRASGETAMAPYPAYMQPYGWPWAGFGGLFCFGFLAFIVILFLVFGAARAYSRRGYWGGHGWHHGPWGAPPGKESEGGSRGVPPVFDEWHRRAHGSPAEDSAKV